MHSQVSQAWTYTLYTWALQLWSLDKTWDFFWAGYGGTLHIQDASLDYVMKLCLKTNNFIRHTIKLSTGLSISQK